MVDIDSDLQWNECNLEGMPPKKIGMSYHDMGKASIVPHEELPKTFKAKDGNEYLIEDIHTVWGGSGFNPGGPPRLLKIISTNDE